MTARRANPTPDARVLVVAPVGRDAAVVCAMLARAGLEVEPCEGAAALGAALDAGAAAVVLTEEGLGPALVATLDAAHAREPAWSDLPIVLLASRDAGARGPRAVEEIEALQLRHNVTLLERPVSVRALTSAVRAAVRARGRQYQARDLFAELASAADERARLLERERAARAEAETANRLKDDFLATVSHELRTPLTAILGWAHMLAAGTLPDARRPHAVETIERNARAQAQLVDDILDVSRIVAGKLRIAHGRVDLVPVLEAALDAVRPAAEARGVVLEVSLAPEACVVLGDADRLRQVASNLLSNAVKFTPRGGRVTVALARTGAHAELIVRDTGEGVAPEFLPHLFERFRQADTSSTRSHGGLGLGLAIVHEIVELHGGTVEARSEGLGTGATFVVRIPTAPPGPTP